MPIMGILKRTSAPKLYAVKPMENAKITQNKNPPVKKGE